MRHIVRAARFQLIGRPSSLTWPWLILALSYLINLAIFAIVERQGGDAGITGGLASIYGMQIVVFSYAMTRGLPFAMSLSVSRRAYYTGLWLYALVQAAVYAAVLHALLLVENATDGWGVSMEYFGISYLRHDNPLLQYLVYLVPFLVMAAIGCCIGLVHQRWRGNGLLGLWAATIAVGGLAAVALTWWSGWGAVGSWFAGRSAAGLVAGYPLVLAAALAGVGYLVIRRATP